jgi:hypothetical protein
MQASKLLCGKQLGMEATEEDLRRRSPEASHGQ